MPRQAADGTMRSAIAIRTATDLKDKLEAEAAKNNRTIGQEAEIRLLRSFENLEPIQTDNWSDATRNISRIIGLVLNQIDQLDGRRWCDTHEGVTAAQKAVSIIFNSSEHLLESVPRGTTKADLARAESLESVAVAVAKHLTFQVEKDALGPALRSFHEAEIVFGSPVNRLVDAAKPD